MKIKNIIILILLLLSITMMSNVATANSNGIMPFIMFPYFMGQNNGTDAFTNYMILAMIFNYPPFDSSVYNTYNSYSPVGSTHTRYAPESESGWSLYKPREYKIEESSTGEIIEEDMGFVEPYEPDRYNSGYEPDSVSSDDAMNEAGSSNVATSSDGAEDSTSGTSDNGVSDGGEVDTGSGDSGGFDSGAGGYDSGFSGDSGGFDGGGSSGE